MSRYLVWKQGDGHEFGADVTKVKRFEYCPAKERFQMYFGAQQITEIHGDGALRVYLDFLECIRCPRPGQGIEKVEGGK